MELVIEERHDCTIYIYQLTDVKTVIHKSISLNIVIKITNNFFSYIKSLSTFPLISLLKNLLDSIDVNKPYYNIQFIKTSN
jgi:endo-1,4-beta-mannosidase